jgi:hypothetical protein
MHEKSVGVTFNGPYNHYGLKTKVIVQNVDILSDFITSTTEVIVNAANKKLQHKGGIAKSISDATIEKEGEPSVLQRRSD